MSFKSSTCLLDTLTRRALIGNIYPESLEYRNKLKSLLKKPVTIYAGFDATASSLHIGNLAAFMGLLHFHQHGHRVICVIGDATTQIGDPSGHTKERKKIDNEAIGDNADSIETTVLRLFENYKKYFHCDNKSALQKPIVVRNSTWYKDKNVIGFIGEIFREIRIGEIMHRKSISERLKSSNGMNMSEFCYQILQAYDWLELRRRYDCKLQLGGADQAGNIYTGHDLIKKRLDCKESIGLLTPLITSSISGKKLGKSNENSQGDIWLKPELTSPFKLYQYFHRTPDADVEKLLRIYSFHDEKTVEDLIYTHLKKSEDVWYCQRVLAEHVCQLVHGEQGLISAKKLSHAFFARDPLTIAKLSQVELDELFEADSIIEMLHRDGLRVLDLIRRANCFRNDLDAERVIEAGGLRINGAQVTSMNVPITSDLIVGESNITLMRIGKKNFYLFKWK